MKWVRIKQRSGDWIINKDDIVAVHVERAYTNHNGEWLTEVRVFLRSGKELSLFTGCYGSESDANRAGWAIATILTSVEVTADDGAKANL